MRPFRSRHIRISARLLILSAFAMPVSAAPAGEPTEPVPEIEPGIESEVEYRVESSAAPGTTPAPVADPCLSALQAATAEAERLCSDQIAGLRYEGTAGRATAALPGALNNRAMARMNAGDIEGAAADLSEALELAPDAWALYLNRARLALMNGDAAAALNDLGRARELAAPDSAVDTAANRTAVLAWRMLGNLGAAETLLGQTLAQERASVVGSRKSFSPARPTPLEPAPPPG